MFFWFVHVTHSGTWVANSKYSQKSDFQSSLSNKLKAEEQASVATRQKCFLTVREDKIMMDDAVGIFGQYVEPFVQKFVTNNSE